MPGSAPGLVGVALCMLLGACAGLQDPISGWPADIPPAKYFVNAYEKDPQLDAYQTLDEYLYWVRGFYAGTILYPRGWSAIAHDVTHEAPGDARDLASRLALLGRDIAAEWAKPNSYRRVDSRHLAVWGEAAERSVGKGNIDETLAKITEDLKQLLARNLDPDSITADRYHDPDPDDWFAL